MPTVAEHAVVCPVGRERPDRGNGDVVNEEHNCRKNRQSRPPVGDHAVNLIGNGKLARALFLVAGLHQGGDIHIPLIGDDGLRVVVQFFFRRFDVRLDVLHRCGINGQTGEHLVVALENLDGVPTLLLLGHIMYRRFLNMGDGVLHRAGKRVLGDGFAVLCRVNRRFRRFHNAGAFEGGDLHNLTAQLAGKFLYVDLIPALFHHVHHVDGDDNRDPKLGKLGGQVQVSFQIGAVHDVENRVRALPDQVVSCHHFLQRIRRKRVNAGQVHDDHVIMLFQFALFLFHRNARPVTHKLVGAGQRVEQGRFTAVGVARQCDLNTHFFCFLSFLR